MEKSLASTNVYDEDRSFKEICDNKYFSFYDYFLLYYLTFSSVK